MAIKTYNDQNFVAIANAIRAKNGETTQYKPSEMAPAIMAIESGLELLPQDTAAGAIANFPDGSNNYPVVELIANIDPKQAGSGDPSPDNVRQISGFTAMNISKQGKNLWSVDSEQSITRSKLVTFPSPLKAGTYTLTAAVKSTTADTLEFCQVTVNTIIGGTVYAPLYVSQGMVRTFTVSEPIVSFTLYSSAGYSASAGVTTVLENIQIEVGSAATAYEPYQAPEVKTIDLGRTVYFGTLNVTTGVLTVYYKYLSISEVPQAYSSAGSGYFGGRLNVPDMKFNQRTNGYCETLIAVNSPSAQTINCVCFGANNKDIFIVMSQDLIGSTLESLNSYLSSNPVNVLYPLDTPEVYQLTPEQVKTLLGVNNIYADTGNVEVTYRADIDLYIAKKIAEGA